MLEALLRLPEIRATAFKLLSSGNSASAPSLPVQSASQPFAESQQMAQKIADLDLQLLNARTTTNADTPIASSTSNAAAKQSHHVEVPSTEDEPSAKKRRLMESMQEKITKINELRVNELKRKSVDVLKDPEVLNLLNQFDATADDGPETRAAKRQALQDTQHQMGISSASSNSSHNGDTPITAGRAAAAGMLMDFTTPQRGQHPSNQTAEQQTIDRLEKLQRERDADEAAKLDQRMLDAINKATDQALAPLQGNFTTEQRNAIWSANAKAYGSHPQSFKPPSLLAALPQQAFAQSSMFPVNQTPLEQMVQKMAQQNMEQQHHNQFLSQQIAHSLTSNQQMLRNFGMGMSQLMHAGFEPAMNARPVPRFPQLGHQAQLQLAAGSQASSATATPMYPPIVDMSTPAAMFVPPYYFPGGQSIAPSTNQS